MKTLGGWHESGVNFNHYCKPGDAVAENIVDYFADYGPTRTCTKSLMQAGEPVSRKEDRQGRWRTTYDTFAKRNRQWYYCGDCFAGEDTP